MVACIFFLLLLHGRCAKVSIHCNILGNGYLTHRWYDIQLEDTVLKTYSENLNQDSLIFISHFFTMWNCELLFNLLKIVNRTYNTVIKNTCDTKTHTITEECDYFDMCHIKIIKHKICIFKQGIAMLRCIFLKSIISH